MKTRKIYIPAGLAVLAVCGLLSQRGPAPESTEPALRPEGALVTLVAGDVNVVRVGKGSSVPLYGRDYVFPGDRVVTGADGRVELTMQKPNRTARIERATVVTMEGRVVGDRLSLSGAQVDTGDVWIETASGGLPFALDLGTPRVTVAEGVVAVSRRSSTRLMVFEGEARFDSGEQIPPGSGIALGESGHRLIVDVSGFLTRSGWRAEQAPIATAQDERMLSTGPTVLTRAIRDLNPRIYLGVELEFEGEDRGEGFRASEARIRKIRVRSEAWDRLQPGEKVELLNDTFDVLKRRYPGIENTVVLEFDDARPELQLKYALDLRS